MRAASRALCIVFATAGCGEQALTVAVGSYARLEPILSYADIPSPTPPETCWAEDIVQKRILVDDPEPTTRIGASEARSVALWSRFNRDARPQSSVEQRRVVFEVPCERELNQDQISTLQRALAVRGVHMGEVTGTIDEATRVAIFAYQSARTLHSDILARETAVQLGILAPRATGDWWDLSPAVRPPETRG